MKKMQIGQVIDFLIDYNERQEKAAKKAKKEETRGKRRKASQSDINSYFG